METGGPVDAEKTETHNLHVDHDAEEVDERCAWMKPEIRKCIQDCRYLVFPGGGAKAISIVAALSVLEKFYSYINHWRDLIREDLLGAAGTSIGSAIALAVVCGMTSKGLRELVLDPKTWEWDQFVKASNPQFLTEKGFCDHSVLYRQIDKLMALLELPEDLDFERLYQMTKREFVCNATCMDNNKILFMSRKTTPYLRVRDAICMSMCLPPYIKPFSYNLKEYVDGGMLANYIPDVFPEAQTMGFTMDNAMPEESASFRNKSDNRWGTEMGMMRGNTILWIGRIALALCSKINAARYDALSERYKLGSIIIHTPDFDGIVVSVGPKDIKKLWRSGKQSAIWYIVGNSVIAWCIWEELQRIVKGISHSEHEEELKTQREGPIFTPTETTRSTVRRSDDEKDEDQDEKS